MFHQNMLNVNELPPVKTVEYARERIRENSTGKKIIVLDDDPTGCQTVHGIHVFMHWDEETLKDACEKYDQFYILHNSRSLGEREAYAINAEISDRLLKFMPREDLIIISRSDSTLRGHFLPEISALCSHTGPYDGIVVIPYFKEGGRLTVGDEHLVVVGNELVRAVETEFAKDPVFGFSTSNLPLWIEEKTLGKTRAQDVISISINDIRDGGTKAVRSKLSACVRGQYIVVNATEDQDVEVVVLALQQVEKDGKRFLFRSAASLVKIIMGLENIPLWKPEKTYKKGVIIAGSHVRKTTEQIKGLTDSFDPNHLELTIESILHDEAYFENCVQHLNEQLSQNQTILISTERTYKLSGSDADRLKAGRKISDFLSGLINHLEVEPDFIVAKGGITSNDVAKYGLEIVDAEVLGQILPGIPVWQPGKESKFPNCTYIVFPGNVGEKDSLCKVYEILTS